MPIRALIGLLRQVPLRQRSLLFFSMLFSGITESVGILLLVPLLNVIQNDPRTHSALVQALLKGLSSLGIPPTPGGILGFFLLLLIARSALLYLRETVSVHVQHETVDRLRDRCFDAVLRAEWRWIAAGRSSDHANLLITDVSRVGVGLNFGLAFLVSALTIFAYLCAAFALSWTMAALAIVSCGAVIVALAGQRRQVMSLGESLGRANRAMQATVQESLSGIKLTKILGNERRHLNLFQETMSRLRQQQVSFMTATGRARALYQTLGATVLVAYLYVGLTAFRTPVAELLVLVLIFGRLIPLLSTSQQQYHHWLHALPALRETERLLVEADAVREPAAPMPTRPWAIERGVRLENVTLRYADRNRAALQNISVTFPARTTTAIMGASGAGKSTLADVLMGLLTPDSGTFWVDDAPVEGEARARWRHAVAYVPQDTFLFHDTIRSNLSWARASASDDELRQALQRAAAGFVFDLPKGLDTVVGDGGVRLSGGERQRLALARALLNKPSLLILDEATSALDMENEARVRKAVENLHGDLTVVIIGHRLPTLEHADQVLVMSDGNIAAQGAWAEVRQHMESVV